MVGAGLLAVSAARGPDATRPPVIFLMLDTVRADHLGFYGYERDTSPNLDAFARESIAFKRAFTASPWTPPSVATMLTGLYPSSHGHMPPNSRREAKTGSKRLAPELETLPEVLRRHGYRTAAVSPNPWISSLFGFDQGFETFAYLHKEKADAIVAAGIDLVRSFTRRQDPFFLYLHFFDPHDPYTPPEPYPEMFPASLQRSGYPYGERALRVMRRYDGEIRYLDHELGRFFAFLRREGLYDRSLILVVADHGEQFLEHGRMHHGHALHNEEIHVPLFIRDPRSGRSGEVVEQVVSTVDLFPTLLARLQIPLPAHQAEGLSLFEPGPLARRPGVLSEIHRLTDQRGFVSQDRHKVIFEVPLLPPEEQARRGELWKTPRLVGVYDLEADYFERRPLEDRVMLARLQSGTEAAFERAKRARSGEASIPAGEMTEEVLEQLRSLGYLD
jgi:arylsulfatase A-like enzyme